MDIQRLYQRAAIFQAVRFLFAEHDYLEVETPLRLPGLIPEAHIEPVLSGSWFLQTSPELCMKRLLAAGLPRLFQICKCFRGGERGDRHLPEFTMLEWYRRGGDYQDLMAETKMLLTGLAQRFRGAVGYAGQVLDLLDQNSWHHLSVAEAFGRFAPISVQQALADDCFDEVLVEHVEPHLGFDTPCFLYDYPVALGSLARRSAANPEVVERFELYVRGMELANGFSELTEPAEQAHRFAREAEYAGNRGISFGADLQKFLDDLARIDTACGIALGMDRLVMLLTGAATIDEVVSFHPEGL